uniref:DH domain-containing protein n=1 Tax=Rhabditophanes sp. KR3021 TaxID=114890 RepID=A0AC35UEB0_9BILA
MSTASTSSCVYPGNLYGNRLRGKPRSYRLSISKIGMATHPKTTIEQPSKSWFLGPYMAKAIANHASNNIDDETASNPSTNRTSTISSSTSDDDRENNCQRMSMFTTTSGYSSDPSHIPLPTTPDNNKIAFVVDDIIKSYLISRPLLLVDTGISGNKRKSLLGGTPISKRYHIVIELLETEVNYINDLDDIIQVYATFLANHEEQMGISSEVIFNLFNSLEFVTNFSKELYTELDSSNFDVVSISRAFLKLAEGFNSYAVYCSQYQSIISSIERLKHNSAFVEAIGYCQKLLSHSLPLETFLLKPVQRMLKYHLFFENLLNSYEPDESTEKTAIEKALLFLNTETDKINEAQKKVEHGERLKELQKMFVNCSLEEGLDFTHCGNLLLDASFKIFNSKQRRHLFLFEKMLLVAKERNDCFVCKDCIVTADLMLNELVTDNPLAFQVSSFQNPKDSYVFLADKKETKTECMRMIKETIFNHYAKDIPERAKELLMNMSNDIFTNKNEEDVKSKKHTSALLGSRHNSNSSLTKAEEKRRKSLGAVAFESEQPKSVIPARRRTNGDIFNADSRRESKSVASDGSCHLISLPYNNNEILQKKSDAEVITPKIIRRDADKIRRIYINRSQMVDRMMHPKRSASTHTSTKSMFIEDTLPHQELSKKTSLKDEPVWQANSDLKSKDSFLPSPNVWEVTFNGSANSSDMYESTEDLYADFSDESPNENTRFNGGGSLFEKMLEEEYNKLHPLVALRHDSGIVFDGSESLSSHFAYGTPQSSYPSKHRRISQVAEQIRRIKENRVQERILSSSSNHEGRFSDVTHLASSNLHPPQVNEKRPHSFNSKSEHFKYANQPLPLFLASSSKMSDCAARQ